MGKSPTPLKIVVLPPFTDQPWVKELEEKGHTIIRADTQTDSVPDRWLVEAHLILGPNCHYFNDQWGEKELELAMKWARKKAYPRRKGEKV